MKLFRTNSLLIAGALTALCAFSSARAQAPVPLINNPLVPDHAAPGSAAFNLKVNGTGFIQGSQVFWNGSARITTFSSSSQLVARIKSTDVTTAGTALVTVSTPHPGGGVSNTAFFEIAATGTSVSFKQSTGGSIGSAVAVVSGDFNGDGNPDVAVATDIRGVDVFLGFGNGRFRTGTLYASGLYPAALAAGDFNGDGKMDLAVTGPNNPGVSVLLGNGDGTFQPFRFTSAAPAVPSALAVGDFNGDGKTDLALTIPTSNEILIMLGNGTGTFTTRGTFPTGSQPTSVTTGDFNGDGKLDAAVAENGASAVAVLLGNGDGTLKPAVNYPVGQSGAPLAITTADLNGDGRLDLIAAGESGVSVFLGTGTGTFQPGVQYFGLVGAQAVAVADFNSDGRPDVVVTDSDAGTSSVSVLLGNGDGTLQSPTLWPAGYLPLGIAIGDFNRDGRLDVAVANNTSGFSAIVQSPH